jgi:hypothetical protein
MGSRLNASYYPEECDTTGSECLRCVSRTAEVTIALSGKPTPESASGMFRRMYTYPACHQMEHSFLWACGVQPAPPRAVQGSLFPIGDAAP